MDLYARQQGHGYDVISLHGLFGSQENLGAINKILSEDFRVHGLDVRNHGRSPHCDQMNYKLMASDVIKYLDCNHIKRVDLVGHSMGGKIAMTTALLIPDRIRKLVVMDIAPVDYSPRHSDIFNGLSAVDLSSVKNKSDADIMLSPYIQRNNVRQFLLKNLYSDSGGHINGGLI